MTENNCDREIFGYRCFYFIDEFKNAPVEVAGDDEFLRCGGCEGHERTEVIEKSGDWLRMSGRRRRTIDVEHRYLRPSQLESDGS